MLAIVIPYYKLTFFEATLQSLANQTDKRFKVYIGDDDSPEDCTLLLQMFQNKFDFIYHRFETNLGSISLTKQWERCIALIGQEEWVMILGDDDVLGENVIENFYSNYLKFNNNSNLIRLSTVIWDQENNKKTDSYQHPEWEKASDSFYRKLKGLTRSSLSEYIFTKHTYQKHGFYDFPLAWHSDNYAWLDFSDGKPIYSMNESVAYIRISNQSISGMNHNIKLKKEATVLFFKRLIEGKFGLFDKSQKLNLLIACKNSIFNQDRIKIIDYFYVLCMYLIHGEVVALIKLVKRGVKKIFKYNF